MAIPDWWSQVPAGDGFDPTRYTPTERRDRTPVGQTLARKFPHLEYATVPRNVQPRTWDVRLHGEVKNPWEGGVLELATAAQQTPRVQDFHCITGWSVLDTAWTGLTGQQLVDLVQPVDSVTSVLLHGADQFSTSMWVEDFAKGMLAWGYQGRPLAEHHGFPLRYVAPVHLYQFKGCKWLHRVEFLTEHRLGFWEIRAYSDSALVAENDRYSNPDAQAGQSMAQIRRAALEGF